MNKNCNSCKFCEYCKFCEFCNYCNSCKNCDSCNSCEFCENLVSGFMCINLKFEKKDKSKYYIFNKEVTKEEWDNRYSLKQLK